MSVCACVVNKFSLSYSCDMFLTTAVKPSSSKTNILYIRVCGFISLNRPLINLSVAKHESLNTLFVCLYRCTLCKRVLVST